MDAGYFPTNYWAVEYWGTSYWGKHPLPIIDEKASYGDYNVRRKRELIMLIRDYLKMKLNK